MEEHIARGNVKHVGGALAAGPLTRVVCAYQSTIGRDGDRSAEITPKAAGRRRQLRQLIARFHVEQVSRGGLPRAHDRHAGIEPWQTVVSYLRYRNEVATVDAMLKAMQQQDDSPLPLQDDTPQQTYVLVIGESTNRTRMSLYGYGRDTTPRLDSMRERLVVFDDVIATRPDDASLPAASQYFEDTTVSPPRPLKRSSEGLYSWIVTLAPTDARSMREASP